MNRVVCSRTRPEMATDIVTYRSNSPIPANRNLEGCLIIGGPASALRDS